MKKIENCNQTTLNVGDYWEENGKWNIVVGKNLAAPKGKQYTIATYSKDACEVGGDGQLYPKGYLKEQEEKRYQMFWSSSWQLGMDLHDMLPRPIPFL